MSVMGAVRVDDPDGLHNNGPRKRPLSIIQENDSDDGDNEVAGINDKAGVKGTDVKDARTTANNNNNNNNNNNIDNCQSKETSPPSHVATTAKSVPKNNGVVEHDVKKRPIPQKVDTHKANAQASEAATKSPRTKLPMSPDSKIASKILQFSKSSSKVAPKPDPVTRGPQSFRPKIKSSSPSSSPTRVGSPSSSASKSASAKYSAGKSPSCSQPKSANPSRRTDSPNPKRQTDSPNPTQRTDSPNPNRRTDSPNPNRRTDSPNPKRQTDSPNPSQRTDSPNPNRRTDSPKPKRQTDSSNQNRRTDSPKPKPKANSAADNDESIRKNIVRRTVSMIESNASASRWQTARLKVKAECSKRKTSKGDVSAPTPTDVAPDKHISNQAAIPDTQGQNGNSQSDPPNSSSPRLPSPSPSPHQPETSSNDPSTSSTSTGTTVSHSSPKDTEIDSKPNQGLSDRQALSSVREATRGLHLKSPTPLFPKSSPSPPSIRVPFSMRQSPKLSHRPLTDTFSKSSVAMTFNLLSVPGQFSNKGDSGTSDSENEDNQSHQGLTAAGDNNKPRHSSRSPFLMPKFHGRRGSYFFKRRMSSESLASLSETESADNSEDQMMPISASDFIQLKETADRLRLTTRRPSVLQWRQQYVESPGNSPGFSFKNGINGDSKDERLTSERKQKIDEALEWLRNELHEMRSQDQLLARQLLTIRNDIHQLKLRRCTAAHQELLDDFKLEYEELQEFSDVLDIPQPIYEDNPLKHIGVTRLNISARRFSAC